MIPMIMNREMFFVVSVLIALIVGYILGYDRRRRGHQ
jgi:uncharacterized membrane protein YhiD involved in acid resistance